MCLCKSACENDCNANSKMKSERDREMRDQMRDRIMKFESSWRTFAKISSGKSLSKYCTFMYRQTYTAHTHKPWIIAFDVHFSSWFSGNMKRSDKQWIRHSQKSIIIFVDVYLLAIHFVFQ